MGRIMRTFIVNIGYPFNVSLVAHAKDTAEASSKISEWCKAHDYALDGIQVMVFELNDRIYLV